MSNSTIIDVAKLAGVSKSTVSLVLNQSDRVHPDTAEKVWQAIRLLNYVPNRAARSLQSGRSNIIGLIVSDITNPYYSELVRSVATVARSQNYDVVSLDLHYDSALMHTHLERLQEYKPDGLLLFTHHQDLSVIEKLKQSQLPTVLLNWGDASQKISKLNVDYQAGMMTMVEHLAGLGHRRLAFIAALDKYGDSSGKVSAFNHAYQAFNHVLAPPVYLESDLYLNHETASSVVDQLLSIEPARRPTAVFAANDLMAISILYDLQDAGVDVPGQMSLVGIDDIDLASFIRPTLTTLRQPRRQIGILAFDMLQQMLNHEVPTGMTESISLRLIERASSGRAPV